MPGLLRARRRLRPGQRADQGPAATATTGSSTGRRCGRPRPRGRLVLRARPHRAGLRAAPRPVVPAGAAGPARRRGPADRAADRRSRSSTRSSSTAPAPPPTSSSASPATGWRVAMGLLGFERGVSTLGQQIGFARELDGVVALARENGALDDPVLRDRLAGREGGARGDALQRAARAVGRDRRRGVRVGQGAPRRSPSWCGPAGTAGSASSALEVAGPRRARPSARRTSSTSGSGSSSSPAPTPSTAAPTRSSATSSPSGCSACRKEPTRMTATRPEQPAPDVRARPRPARRQGGRRDGGCRRRDRRRGGATRPRGGRRRGGARRHP